MSPHHQPELDPALADAIRRAYVWPVDEATAGRHVRAIVAVTAGAGAPARAARPRRRAWRVCLAAGAATLVAPVGLAAAGVSLPHAVQQPFRTVGIELPNQASDDTPAPPAPAVHPVRPRRPATPATARRLSPSAPTSRPRSGRGRAQPITPPGRTGRPQSGRGRAHPKLDLRRRRVPFKVSPGAAPRSRFRPQADAHTGGTKPQATPSRSTARPPKSRAPRD